MPAIAVQGGLSTGHACFPPTSDIGPYTTTAFFGGKAIQLRGVTRYAPHTCGKTTHPGDGTQRIIVNVPGTFYMEGKPVAMIGDMIDCGDAVGKGAESTFTT